MKTTIRTNLNAVNPSAANNQLLEYRLKVKGSRANFGWADDEKTAILTHQDFGMLDELVWQLKTSLDASGKVNFAVPQKPSYSRVEDPGAATDYTLTLLFVTAVGYTLTVKLCDSGGNPVQTITDIDYTMEQPKDSTDQSLGVNV